METGLEGLLRFWVARVLKGSLLAGGRRLVRAGALLLGPLDYRVVSTEL